MGSEAVSFLPLDSDSYDAAGNSDTSFARASMKATGSSNFDSLDIGAPDDFWCHFDFTCDLPAHGSTYRDMITFRTSGGTDVFRVQHIATGCRLQALIAAVWTTVGSVASAALNNGDRQTFDLHVEGNSATGNATLYIAGVERITAASVDLSAVTAIDTIRGYGTASNPCLSQVIVADEPTIGWRLLTRYPNGAGADTAWVGDYTGVDETTNSDADFVNSGTATQVETFTQTGPVITGYIPRAVGVYFRSRRGAGGPQNIQAALRSAGTNYFSASKAQSLGYGIYGNIWETNPATAADWLSTAIDALQPGVKSIA